MCDLRIRSRGEHRRIDGQLIIVIAIALFVGYVTFSFWIQSRVLAVNFSRATAPEMLARLSRRRNHQSVFQRSVLGAFLACALAIVILRQGAPQIGAAVITVEILGSIFLLELESKRHVPSSRL